MLNARKLQETSSVPYFCQWESATLALDIIEDRATPADDPLWAASGAASREDYITWANHVCGLACLKMILAARTGEVIPTLELLRRGLPYGIYTINEGHIFGMIYAPFVSFVREEFGIAAEVRTKLSAQDIPDIMDESAFFIASVHPWVRWPERVPPKKGGHLVLVTAADDAITFHNPSGHDVKNQADAKVSLKDFDKFFAGRGIAIFPEGNSL